MRLESFHKELKCPRVRSIYKIRSWHILGMFRKGTNRGSGSGYRGHNARNKERRKERDIAGRLMDFSPRGISSFATTADSAWKLRQLSREYGAHTEVPRLSFLLRSPVCLQRRRRPAFLLHYAFETESPIKRKIKSIIRLKYL